MHSTLEHCKIEKVNLRVLLMQDPTYYECIRGIGITGGPTSYCLYVGVSEQQYVSKVPEIFNNITVIVHAVGNATAYAKDKYESK